MIDEKVFLKRCDNMFVGFEIQPELHHGVMQDMAENLRVGFISGVTGITA